MLHTIDSTRAPSGRVAASDVDMQYRIDRSEAVRTRLAFQTARNSNPSPASNAQDLTVLLEQRQPLLTVLVESVMLHRYCTPLKSARVS